jgi:hypothetical protein
MQKLHSLRRIAAIAVVAGFSIGPALADCPSLPDGPESYNVANGEAHALCLQQELHNTTVDRNTQTQLNSLRTSMDQLQIQRRFDNLPRIAPPPPWQSQTTPWQF